MKITALVENTSNSPAIGAEHGLSLYIETNGMKILFDMGQSDLFAKNAEALGIDLSEVDLAVLSHGHYDHGGGLKRFLERNEKAPVYVNRCAFEPHYNGTEKYIGLDPELKNSRRIRFTGDTEKIGGGLTLLTFNDRKKIFELGSFELNTLEYGKFVPDDFRHEQYLLIEEDGKRVLLSGCSHKGILNIAKWAEADVLIGGFHFSKIPLGKTLAEYARFLDRFDTAYYTCHCTGNDQFHYMQGYMHRLSYLSAGQTITI